MAESTFSLTFWDLVSRVSDYLGYGLSPASDNLTRVRQCVEDGYQQFLYPKLANESVHKWSFLRPSATLAMTADIWQYTLPDDFGEVVAGFHYPSGTGYPELYRVSMQSINEARMISDETGEPRMYAIQPITLASATGQRWQLSLYPTPATSRTMIYSYQVLPGKLGVTKITQACTIAANKESGTTATCSIATTTVTDSAAHFVSYGVAADDSFAVTAGTATAGVYTVASVTSETVLVLTATAGTGTATYTVGDLLIKLTGAGNYTTAAIVAGDRVILSASSGPTEGIYTVSSKVSTTALCLTATTEASGAATMEAIAATAYPYGGMPHRQTILESCLQQAEFQVNDSIGPHAAMYEKCLARSVALDRDLGASFLGYNGDSSDGADLPAHVARSVTVNGVTVFTG